MRRTLFKSKIHRATVTQADLDYEGSVTIDEDLLDAAGILRVRGRPRVEHHPRYAPPDLRLKGPRGSGVVCINGAAAHLNGPGDMVILATFAEIEEARGPHLHAQGGAGGRRQPHHGGRRGRGARTGAAGVGMTVFLWRR